MTDGRWHMIHTWTHLCVWILNTGFCDSWIIYLKGTLLNSFVWWFMLCWNENIKLHVHIVVSKHLHNIAIRHACMKLAHVINRPRFLLQLRPSIYISRPSLWISPAGIVPFPPDHISLFVKYPKCQPVCGAVCVLSSSDSSHCLWPGSLRGYSSWCMTHITAACLHFPRYWGWMLFSP